MDILSNLRVSFFFLADIKYSCKYRILNKNGCLKSDEQLCLQKQKPIHNFDIFKKVRLVIVLHMMHL